MSEALNIISGSKKEQYVALLPQIAALVQGETNIIANMANICAALKTQFNWWWVGFYIVENKNELVLGSFQGPIACTRIKIGKGVCGTALLQKKTLIVPNVENFNGHIACSSLSKSEIVVPILRRNEVAAVLDADSEQLSHFDETDQFYLEALVKTILV